MYIRGQKGTDYLFPLHGVKKSAETKMKWKHNKTEARKEMEIVINNGRRKSACTVVNCAIVIVKRQTRSLHAPREAITKSFKQPCGER